MDSKAIQHITNGIEALRADIKSLDSAIEHFSANPNDAARMALLDRRSRAAAQIEELERVIARMRAIEAGQAVDSQTAEKKIDLSRYSLATRLNMATRMYLIDHGGGPVQISDLVRDLTIGGFRIKKKRSKYHKDAMVEPTVREVHMMVSNDRGANYVYDAKVDTIELKRPGFEPAATVRRTQAGMLVPRTV